MHIYTYMHIHTHTHIYSWCGPLTQFGFFMWPFANCPLFLLYLDDLRVSERLVQDVHLAAELQGVNDEVLVSGGDLHQRRDAQEAPVGVVLERTKTENVRRRVGQWPDRRPHENVVTSGQATGR